MTRIFDALRKARVGAPPEATPPPAPIAPVTAAPAYLPPPRAAASRAPERHAETGGESRARILPFAADVELSEDVLREMTTLRVGLEVALGATMPRVVIFVSSQGGEGTSTVAAQFAISLARYDGLRTLLVDTHFRRTAPWFAAAGAAPVRPLHPTEREAGEAALRRPDLLPLAEEHRQQGTVSAPLIRAMLDAVAGRYDWILLDGPPVLESPDTAALSASADGVVIVVQAGRTKRPVLARSVDLLRKGGGRVLGSVLNRRRLEIPEFIYRRI
jgi:Mrp family chromosome partitioning ATPase